MDVVDPGGRLQQGLFEDVTFASDTMLATGGRVVPAAARYAQPGAYLHAFTGILILLR